MTLAVGGLRHRLIGDGHLARVGLKPHIFAHRIGEEDVQASKSAPAGLDRRPQVRAQGGPVELRDQSRFGREPRRPAGDLELAGESRVLIAVADPLALEIEMRRIETLDVHRRQLEIVASPNHVRAGDRRRIQHADFRKRHFNSGFVDRPG